MSNLYLKKYTEDPSDQTSEFYSTDISDNELYTVSLFECMFPEDWSNRVMKTLVMKGTDLLHYMTRSGVTSAKWENGRISMGFHGNKAFYAYAEQITRVSAEEIDRLIPDAQESHKRIWSTNPDPAIRG
jgi:hypothetical protein